MANNNNNNNNNNDEEFDVQAYRKFLFSHFPSGYLKDKINDSGLERNRNSENKSKHNRRKRKAPFTELIYPVSKKQKTDTCEVDDKVGNGQCEETPGNMSQYANIITTRSGNKIKVPNRQWQQMQSMLKSTTTTTGTNGTTRAPKAVSAPGSSSSGSRGGTGVVSSGTQSSQPKGASASSSHPGSKKSLKKTFQQPPPESSTDDDGDDGMEDSVSGGGSGTSGSGSGSTNDNDSCDRGGAGPLVSAFRKKQATAHLKKLLSKKMNIIITMNRPSSSSDSSSPAAFSFGKGKAVSKINHLKKSKSISKSKSNQYEEDEPEYDDEEEGMYPDEEFDDADDDDDDVSDEEGDSSDYDDDDDDEDDDEEDDDDDDDDYDDDDDGDDDDDDDYDGNDEETPTALSRNASSSSLFSASGNLTAVSSPANNLKDQSFINDAEFMKFVQRSPLNLLRGKGTSDKEEQTMDVLFTSISEMYKSDPDNHVLRAYYYQLKNACKQIKQDKVKRTLKEKKQNCKEFKKLLKKRNSTNDVLYFKKNFTPEKQAELIEEIRAVNKISYSEVPYRLSVLQAPIPRLFKSIALNKISTLRNMDPGSGEFYKIKNWVDGFMKIPFDNEKLLPVTLETHGREACSAFMDNAKKQLDDAVYGLDDAKLQLMQLVGQWISNPQAMGTAVAIHGPPGTGKTSLIKEGVSKILGRDFAFIALGGATDSSFLEGHSYTYEGSTWGKIVDILIQCKSTNPVIYFDELDKISNTPKGDEIVGILTHLTDTSQNNQFHDKYFSEIVFDLSKCLFIFSYNDESQVNRVLLDRMYRIRTSGYSAKQKICITQNYLVPKIIDQVRFAMHDVTITSEVIEYIVENYTEKEEGVRNLKRCLEIIHTKLNLHRLMTPGAIVSMFPKEFKATDVQFPFAVTRDNLEHLLKKNETRLAYGMYL